MEDKDVITIEAFRKYANETKDNILRELSKVYGVYDFLLDFPMNDSQTLDEITDIGEDFFRAIREEVCKQLQEEPKGSFLLARNRAQLIGFAPKFYYTTGQDILSSIF